MEEKSIINEKQDSIKIAKNSKGYTWEIKLYYDQEADNCLAELKRINDIIKKEYGDV